MLNAIADIMNSGIFEKEMGKSTMIKTMVCSTEKIAKEKTTVKTKPLYDGLIQTFMGPHSDILPLIWNLCRPNFDPALSFL